jgi:hypothetical protein
MGIDITLVHTTHIKEIVSLSMDMWNINLHQQESLQLIFQEGKRNMWGTVD